ncbi:MAG TPA: hypothetical protein VGF79_12040 [Bacteroidia bacterium]
MDSIFRFLPVITTILAAIFAFEISALYRKWKTKYLLWWTIGIINFGIGTLSESINIFYGWSELNLKFWYITGAVLGGFTIAQGTAYFVLPNKLADRFTLFWVIYIGVAMTCIILSPAAPSEDSKGVLTGADFQWEWVRYFSPFINAYAFVFSFGGGVYSANKYFQQITKESRFIGCIYISVGSLAPSIGGIYTKMGYIDILFITELVGLGLIYKGFKIIKEDDF